MDRLERVSPGAGLGPSEQLADQLFQRDRELKAPRAGLGEGLSSRAPTTRACRKVADPYPNAPLLKRLVLYPYVQDCARPVRDVAGDRTVPWSVLKHDAVEYASQQARSSRVPLETGGPLRSQPRARVAPRERVSASEWLEQSHE